jgi:hypothetical protein
MEKLLPKKIVRGTILAGIGVLGLSVCGQTDPPTPNEFNDDVEYIVLEGVVAANGEPVRCAMYGSETSGISDSKSWFGFDCDFEGTATFPGEVVGG